MSAGVNGLTTTENDAKDTGADAPVVLYGEVIGACFSPEGYEDEAITVTVKLPYDTRVAHWFVRLEVVDPPRVSPDCEGTGRCSVES